MSAELCEKCGGATLRIEFRDQFVRLPGQKFNPRANGMWIVCAECQHEWPGSRPDSQPEETTT